MQASKLSMTFAVALLWPLQLLAQVPPPGTTPAGEGRLPTQPAPGTEMRPGGDDCRRQAEQLRQQFDVQEKALRRELADRAKLADATERERLRAESEQRIASLRAEAAEAERRVLATCRG